MDDIIGSVTGVSTFHELEITNNSEKERYEVKGHYQGSVTIYATEEENFQIEGMLVKLQEDGEMTVSPSVGNDFVWVEATEETLNITRENPKE